MGLCKCPKRKVTNLFCFEHRVNVCEHCLIDNHPKCVVKSYLNWLKDSDYDPNCALCSIPLTDGEVVRLLCYDVFHVRCLEKHYRSLPPNTAPAGYRCYSCDSPVFPSQNQAGYVIDHLRDVFSKYNWARVGLCLPLIDEPEMTVLDDEPSDFITDRNDDSLHGSPIAVQSYALDAPATESNVATPNVNFANVKSTSSSNMWQITTTTTRSENRSKPTPTSTVLSMDNMTPSDDEDTKAVARKLLPDPHTLLSINYRSEQDPDGPDKYKRRSAWSWLKRWLKSRMLRGRNYRDTKASPRRMVVLLLIGLIALLTFIAFATRVGRSSSDSDPNFDPMLNPNIHVARKRVLPPNFDIGGGGGDAVDPLQNVKPVDANRVHDA